MTNNPTATKGKQRNSGIELFRIVAMLLVVVVHTDGKALHGPGTGSFSIDFMDAAVRTTVQQLAVVCVDCFVVISGWFGIRITLRGVASLLFQAAFISGGAYCVAAATGHATFCADNLLNSLNVLHIYWFLTAYLGLMAVSPALNALAKHATKRQLQQAIAWYAAFAFIVGWAADMGGFNWGYSTMSFMLIYMIMRYLRLHGSHIVTRLSAVGWLGCYVGIALAASAVIVAAGVWGSGESLNWIYMHLCAYDSPSTIAASICLFMAFCQFRFTSRIVNRVAASAFSVYLLHCCPTVFPAFLDTVSRLHRSLPLIGFSAAMMCLVAATFAVSVVADQLRLLVWRPIGKLLHRDR